MSETLNKITFKGFLSLKAGQILRYPPDKSLSTPWTGFYIHNLSGNYIYFDIDADASDAQSIPFYDWDWRSFEDFAVQKYISFYGASASTIFVMGYTSVETRLIAPDAMIDRQQPPFAERPLVADPEFHPHSIPRLNIEEDGGKY